jgi:hypothetical protein
MLFWPMLFLWAGWALGRRIRGRARARVLTAVAGIAIAASDLGYLALIREQQTGLRDRLVIGWSTYFASLALTALISAFLPPAVARVVMSVVVVALLLTGMLAAFSIGFALIVAGAIAVVAIAAMPDSRTRGATSLGG